eukprot:Awhi_evm1s7765
MDLEAQTKKLMCATPCCLDSSNSNISMQPQQQKHTTKGQLSETSHNIPAPCLIPSCNGGLNGSDRNCSNRNNNRDNIILDDTGTINNTQTSVSADYSIGNAHHNNPYHNDISIQNNVLCDGPTATPQQRHSQTY